MVMTTAYSIGRCNHAEH